MTPERLIDIYLDQLMSTDSHAGWHQPSTIQRFIEFRGELPPPSGNDQADLKMITEMIYLKQPHALYPLARKLLHSMPDSEYLAVIADRYYDKRVDSKGRRMTEPKISQEIELSLGNYKHYKRNGYLILSAQIDLIKMLAA
jgi:hypothetical protein